MRPEARCARGLGFWEVGFRSMFVQTVGYVFGRGVVEVGGLRYPFGGFSTSFLKDILNAYLRNIHEFSGLNRLRVLFLVRSSLVLLLVQVLFYVTSILFDSTSYNTLQVKELVGCFSSL